MKLAKTNCYFKIKRSLFLIPWVGKVIRLVLAGGMVMAGLIFISFGIGNAQAATVTWIASGTNDWFGTNNWSSQSAPTNGDEVVINYTNVGVLLTNTTAELSSLLITNAATLIFSNWDTTLNATNIYILRNAIVTCVGPLTNNVMTNNVYLNCSNLTVAGGGKIDVNGKGYRGGYYTTGGYGPGGAVANTAHGASHGGMGGGQTAASSAPKYIYDRPESPNLAGSGGAWWNGLTCHGGGAIRVAATGTVTVDGVVSANATDSSDNSYGGGSGGAVWITCSRIIGTGVVSAAGGKGGAPTGYGGHGGGGRIAIVYDTAAQQGTCDVSFVARPGIGNANGPPGEIGTLWFTDTQLFPTNPGLSQFVGQVISGAGVYNFDTLAFNGGWVRFLTSNQVLRVTNDLRVAAGGTFDAGGESWLWNSGYGFMRFASNLPTVQIGGNFLIGSGAVLNIYSALTNAAQPTGALVTVGGLLAVTNGSAVYPYSH
ncbi:MAG: G8 domain-containing protein, partial [Lentisphaerae bacterium]|nr:G8 domain-containing protein [Lentisphaerota bacterium]